jgi:hypothetical protein
MGEAHGAQRGIRNVGWRTLVEGGYDFAHEPQQDAVDHECGGVLDQDGGLFQAPGEFEGGREHGVVGLRCPDNFEQRHDGHGIEEVEAHEPLGMPQVCGHGGHGQ